MKFKDNVVITGNCLNLFDNVIKDFEKQVSELLQIDNYEATITSGNDGTHTNNSLHYKNRAIDLRIKDIGIDGCFRKQLFEAVVFVIGYLYPEFVFIAHIYDGANHLHIQHGKENIKNPESLTGDHDNIVIK